MQFWLILGGAAVALAVALVAFRSLQLRVDYLEERMNHIAPIQQGGGE